MGCLLDDRPVTVPVHHDHQVVVTVMHWNGYSGWMGGVGRAPGCDGAMQLQEEQRACISVIVGVMPGQKNDSACENIMVTLWWAECGDLSTWSQRDGGIMIQSL